MKLRFESDLAYQTRAVDAVVDLFEDFAQDQDEFSLTAEIVPNVAPTAFLDWDDVQSRYHQAYRLVDPAQSQGPSPSLEKDSGYPLKVAGDHHVEYPSFTVEMETGTGKTYVYLKTLYTLNQRYRFRKFLIVVPSRAIYEGVLKTFDDTKSHFDALFGKPNFSLLSYEKGSTSALKSFAESPSPMILLLTLDSFNKANNKIFKAGEVPGSDLRPFQYIARTNPILVLDEPQNMATDTAKQALRCFEPLFALRYSATHREIPNQVYRLTPFEAYRDGLVKKIQVYGLSQFQDLHFSELELVKVDRERRKATLRGYKDDRGLYKFVDSIVVGQNTDIFAKTNNSYHYGLTVDDIDWGSNRVTLSNGSVLELDRSSSTSKLDMFRAQLRETIAMHLIRQDRVQHLGIKVLSLVFIDRVSNYQPTDGVIRRLFEEEFDRAKKTSAHFGHLPASAVHRGYFAAKPKTNGPDEFYDLITGTDQKEAEKAAYELIMRKKEILLSFPGETDSPELRQEKQVSFIFAHSALKEGWDNPNVFQICTLSTSISEIKKRQEIGRGLRLPVDQNGQRLKGLEESILTVVANESYETYVSSLQSEYKEDGELDSPPINNATKDPVKRNEKVFHSQEFQKFWSQLVQRIDYTIEIDTSRFVRQAVEHLNDPKVVFPEPRLFSKKGQFGINQVTIELLGISPSPPNLAHILVEVEDTTDRQLVKESYQSKIVAKGLPLSHYFSDQIFRAFMVESFDLGSRSLRLTDGKTLFVGERLVYHLAADRSGPEGSVDLGAVNLPVPNFLNKIGMELGITKKSVLEVFQGLHPSKKSIIHKNPEGFINEFYKGLKTVYANHVAEKLTFHLETAWNSESARNSSGHLRQEFVLDQPIETFFPMEKKFAGNELRNVDTRFLYEKVQVDSDVEIKFIGDVVAKDPLVVCYFKFPANFKLILPHIIGNYNPDWGIIRRDDDGTTTLHLVRETKGTEDQRKLRFDHEKRKIVCAEKYFDTLEVDYRAISANTQQWWKPRTDAGEAALK